MAEWSKRWGRWPLRDQDSIEIDNPIPTIHTDLTKMLFEEHPYTPIKCRSSVPTSEAVLAGIFGGILILVLLLRLINSLKRANWLN